jgi:hypothetical protein
MPETETQVPAPKFIYNVGTTNGNSSNSHQVAADRYETLERTYAFYVDGRDDPVASFPFQNTMYVIPNDAPRADRRY